jgi:hypothetical protein
MARATVPRDKARPVKLVEPELPTGFPDVVYVYLTAEQPVLATIDLDAGQLRLLHYLYSSRTSLLTSIAENLSLRGAQLKRRLDPLVTLDLLRIDKGRVWLRPRADVFPARRIIAVEAKIGDSRRALHQASANRWFASQSYILLSTRDPPQRVKVAARDLGVGILAEYNGRCSISVRAKPHRIPASYGSWMVAALAARLAKGNSGHA